MRARLGVSSIWLVVCSLSMLLAPVAASAAQANEVVLFSGTHGSGARHSVSLQKGEIQRVFQLAGTPVASGVRSVQVGADLVIALQDLYTLRVDGRGTVFRGPAEQDAQGLFEFVVVTAAMGESAAKPDNLPVRVVLEAQWSTVLFGGNLIRESHAFLGPGSDSPCENIGQKIREQGVDWIYFYSGGLPRHSLAATIFTEPDCRGQGTRVTGDEFAADLWRRDLGDRTRSLTLHWSGPTYAGGGERSTETQGIAMQVVSKLSGPSFAELTEPVQPLTGASDQPPGIKESDQISGLRIVSSSNRDLLVEVDYRVAPDHGTTVYVGGWLLAGGQSVGGYRPAVLPRLGAGTVRLWLNLQESAPAADAVDVFFFEPAADPFLRRIFQFQRPWTP